MVVELEDKPMTDFVFLETVQIKSQDPNVQNENGYSSPCGKVSGKGCTGVFDTEAFIYDNEDKSGQEDSCGSHS